MPALPGDHGLALILSFISYNVMQRLHRHIHIISCFLLYQPVVPVVIPFHRL